MDNTITAPLQDQTSCKRFWGINLVDGTNSLNMMGFYLCCFTAIMLATFVPASQPFLLNEVLLIPYAEQGVLSGTLSFWGEIVIIVTVGFWGSLSDKIGRRAVTAISYVITAAGIALYGLASNPNDLLLSRCIYSAGIAGISTMIITLMADYARDESRGKATGYLGVMNGLGAMIAALALVRLPALYQGQGMDAESAALATFVTMGLVTLIFALLLFLSLRPGTSEQHTDKKGLFTHIKEGFGAAKDSGVALAYGASFVARGNLAVVGTFFTLWASVYGTQNLGMTSAEAIAKGGAIVAISYVAALLSAPVFGILSDRISRVSSVSITMLIALAGYGSTYFVENPFSVPMMICLVFIGMAEVGCIISSGVLIAQQATPALRGSIVGVFTFCGAVGILVASIVGGVLFDTWIKSGPFVFFGFAAGAILIWSLMLRGKVVKPEVN
ncbi:MAG: MFS transporter [Haliea sp.]